MKNIKSNQSTRKDYIWNTIGVFAQNAISPLLLLVITRINGIFDSGLFSFAFSLALIFWALGIWGGRTYQVSDIKQEFSSQGYIAVRLILSVIMLVGSILFSILNGYDFTKTAIIFALVLFKVFESISDAIYGILQVNNRLFNTGKSLFYKATLGFVIFVLIDMLTKDILLSCLGIVAINALVLFIYDIPKAKKFEKNLFSFNELAKYTQEAIVIIKRCSPIASVILLSMFSLVIPRYFIDLYRGSEIGYFGILAMPITALGLVITFMIQPNVVRLSKYLSKKQFENFSNIVNRLFIGATLIGAVGIIGAYLIGAQILGFIFGIDFSSYRYELLIMVIGAVINAYVSIYINILTIMRHFKSQFYTLLISNAALVVVSAVVVKEYGLIGGVSLYTTINFIQVIILAITYKNLMLRMDA